MTTVTVTIYPEIDGEEREFEATARVSLGSSHPLANPDPPEVRWISVSGHGMKLSALDFEAWLAARACPLQLSAYDDAAVEMAVDEGPDAGDYEDARMVL